MTLTQINALLTVLECGGFTEAGKRLFMTQSAVSQAISRASVSSLTCTG